MNTDNLTLERHIKKSTITSNFVSVLVALITALGVGYGFYYNTNNTLNSHTTQIQDVKTDVESLKDAVNNSAIFQGATGEQIKSVELQVNDVKNSQIRIEEKLDRLILKSSK
jgi:uncharacterized protein HemX